MSSELAQQLISQLFATLKEERQTAETLKTTALQQDLSKWTETLTGLVVKVFERMDLHAAAKGYRCSVLPIRGNEYLSQDVMAFSKGEAAWRFPIAVCELENSSRDVKVAYSLWKVLCVRCHLRVVF